MENSTETHDEDCRNTSEDSTRVQDSIEHSSEELPKTYESFINSFDKPVTIYLTKNGTDQASKVTTTLVEEIARRNGMKVVKNQTQYYLEPVVEQHAAEPTKTLTSTVPANTGADTQFQLRGVVVTVPQSNWSSLQSEVSTRVMQPIKTRAAPAKTVSQRRNSVHIFEQKGTHLDPDLTPMVSKSQSTGLLIESIPRRSSNTHALDQQSIPVDLTSMVSQLQPNDLPFPTEMRHDGKKACPSLGSKSNTMMVPTQVSATRTIQPAPRTILPAPVQPHRVPSQPHPVSVQPPAQVQLLVPIPGQEVKYNTVLVNANDGRLYCTKPDIRNPMVDTHPPATVTGRDYIKVRLQEPINGARWVLLPHFDVRKTSSPPLARKCPEPSDSPTHVARHTRLLTITKDVKLPCTSTTATSTGQLITSGSEKKHYRGCYEGSCICPKQFFSKKNTFYNYLDPNVMFAERENDRQLLSGKTITTTTPTSTFVGFNLPSVCDYPVSTKHAAGVNNSTKTRGVTLPVPSSRSCSALDAEKCEAASSVPVSDNSSKCPPPQQLLPAAAAQQQQQLPASLSCSSNTKITESLPRVLSDQ